MLGLWRRRSFLLKLVIIVGTAWLTIAFLLYSDPQQRGNDNRIAWQQQQQEAAAAPEAAPLKDNRIVESENFNRIVPFKEEQLTSSKEIMKPDQQDDGVLAPPRKLYGENGKPVILPNNLTGAYFH